METLDHEFGILDSGWDSKPQDPGSRCAHAVYNQLWKRRCDMDCTYSYFAPDPENTKNRSDPGSSIDPGRNILQFVSENLVRRIRPCDINDAIRLLIPYPSDYSFPSGHTAVSFAAVSALYFAGEKYLWKAALVLAAFIAFSRMYLYVHYPTDILGGALLGILCGYLGCRIVQKTEQYKRKI